MEISDITRYSALVEILFQLLEDKNPGERKGNWSQHKQSIGSLNL